MLLLPLRRLLSCFQITQVRTAYAGIPVRTRVEGFSGMNVDAEDPHAARRTRHEDPEGRIPAVPGRWRTTGAGRAPTAAGAGRVLAGAEHAPQVTVDGVGRNLRTVFGAAAGGRSRCRFRFPEARIPG